MVTEDSPPVYEVMVLNCVLLLEPRKLTLVDSRNQVHMVAVLFSAGGARQEKDRITEKR